MDNIKYESKVIRLSRETIESLELLRKIMMNDRDSIVNYYLSESNYDKLINLLCKEYIESYRPYMS